MEPIDIDWKNISSRYIQDDLYEHLSAPKWFDFSAPDESVDDEAWFCRPDCRHPKCYDDFKVKSSPEIVPLGDRNRRDTTLKRRGILSTIPALRDFNKPDKTPIKAPRKFREVAENENPNCNTFPPTNPSPRRPITSSKILKESIKSSTEKPPKKTSQSDADSVAEPSPLEEKKKLRSTLSARNLFAGREILNQVSDFCSELKKLALNVTEREKRKKKKKEEEPLLEAENSNSKEEEENSSSKIVFSPDASKKSTREDKGTVSKEAGKAERSVLQVRSCPPSPQRFPSPYNRNKLTKTTSLKPPKSRTTPVRGILQELEPNKIAKEPAVVDSEENKKISTSSTEARTLDMLWFLKPCTLNLGE